MSRVWSTEFSSIASAIVALLLSGLLSGHWLLSTILVLVGYILWLYYRLAKLERWLARGTRPSEVYDDEGFVGIIIRHLYQQKKTHNERKKRTKDILSRLNRNISALPDATVLLNSDREIEWSNAPAHYLLNIHTRDDQGQRISNLIRDPQFLSYLRSPQQQDYLEIRSPMDSAITVQLKIVQFGDNQYLLSARNVSDQKRFKEGLKNFVANASHELKSPLTVIAGHLEMLETETELSESGRQSLTTAQRQAVRMRDLIEDLLLLSQVESYQLQPNEGEELWVGELMSTVLDALDPDQDPARLECDIPRDFRLRAVRSEIEGICINLIENAQKYSTPDTPISIGWSENLLGEFCFSVVDQGPGISATDLEHVTRRYYRASSASARQIEGSGLGLAIVKQATAKHGGILEIDSKPGKGSRFQVSFPSYRCSRQAPDLAPVVQLANRQKSS